jgi:hypothetical protein
MSRSQSETDTYDKRRTASLAAHCQSIYARCCFDLCTKVNLVDDVVVHVLEVVLPRTERACEGIGVHVVRSRHRLKRGGCPRQ